MANKKSKSKISALAPYASLIIANVLWGATYAISKVTLNEFPSMTLAFLRFALASLLLAPFLLSEKKKLNFKAKDLPKLTCIALGMIAFNIAFFYEGIKRTSTLDASVLVLIVPVLSVLIGWRLLHEKIYFINLIGIILSLIGSIIVLGFPLLLTGTLTSEVLIGNLLIIFSGISFVIGATLAKKILQSYSVLQLTAIIFLISTLVFAIPAANDYLQNPGWPSQISLLGVFGLFYIVIFASIVAYFTYASGISKVDLSHANLFHYLEPLVAVIIAVLVLNERVSFSFVIGSVLIILGVYWGTLGKIHHHHHGLKGHRI